MNGRAGDWLVVGRVEGAYGIKGWVRIRSFTDPAENIGHYEPWRLRSAAGEREARYEGFRPQGKGFVVRLAGVEDRDAAAALRGAEILVPRASLAPAGEGQYFWSDLLGLEVKTTGGELLGRVERMMETGANDVMVVAGERRRLIPFLTGRVVQGVNLDTGEILVDWDPEF